MGTGSGLVGLGSWRRDEVVGSGGGWLRPAQQGTAGTTAHSLLSATSAPKLTTHLPG